MEKDIQLSDEVEALGNKLETEGYPLMGAILLTLSGLILTEDPENPVYTRTVAMLCMDISKAEIARGKALRQRGRN